MHFDPNSFSTFGSYYPASSFEENSSNTSSDENSIDIGDSEYPHFEIPKNFSITFDQEIFQSLIPDHLKQTKIFDDFIHTLTNGNCNGLIACQTPILEYLHSSTHVSIIEVCECVMNIYDVFYVNQQDSSDPVVKSTKEFLTKIINFNLEYFRVTSIKKNAPFFELLNKIKISSPAFRHMAVLKK